MGLDCLDEDSWSNEYQFANSLSILFEQSVMSNTSFLADIYYKNWAIAYVQ